MQRRLFIENQGASPEYPIPETVAYYPLISDSVALIGGINGVDTDVTYDVQSPPDFQNSANMRDEGEYINLGDSDLWSFNNGPFSVSFRANFRFTNARAIISKWGVVGNREWNLISAGAGALAVTFLDEVAGGNKKYQTGIFKISNTGNYWVVMTYDGTNVSFWVNGVEQSTTLTPTGSYATMQNTAGELWIGSMPENISLDIDAHIGEVILFSKKLEAVDIAIIKDKYDNSLPYYTE